MKPFEIGLQVAQGRRRAKISQEDFARKLGVSRKTLSDLERGVVEHVSLKTAMAALALAGFVLYSAQRRPPTMEEIMARRAADRARAESLLEPEGAVVSGELPESTGPSTTGARRRKRSA
jgi:transcriptional regulator with XRE-family HTH domain